MHKIDQEILVADRPLAAYFASVAEAGPDAWREERFRIAERSRHLPPECRGAPLNLGRIAAMLPTWTVGADPARCEFLAAHHVTDGATGLGKAKPHSHSCIRCVIPCP